MYGQVVFVHREENFRYDYMVWVMIIEEIEPEEPALVPVGAVGLLGC